MSITPRIKWYKIFACPDCKKKFYDLMSLNVHYTKIHYDKERKFVLINNKRVTHRSTSKVRVRLGNQPNVKIVKRRV